MDDPDAQDEPLPFYRADPRAIFDLDDLDRDRAAPCAAASAADPGWEPATSTAPSTHASRGCAQPRGDDGVWLTPRLAALYDELHARRLRALVRAVGRRHARRRHPRRRASAARRMLETMFHTVPHAGNVNLVRTLERLRAPASSCATSSSSPTTRAASARSRSRRGSSSAGSVRRCGA